MPYCLYYLGVRIMQALRKKARLVCDPARQSEHQTEQLKELSLFLLGFLWYDIQS